MAVVLLITAGVVIGLMLNRGDPSDTWFVIGAGALGSLIASLVMLGADVLLPDDADGPAERVARRLDGSLAALRDAVPLVAHAQEHRIHVAKPKGLYDRREWEAVLTTAHDRLLIIGHALDKWCMEDLEPLFVATMTRLARNGRSVRLLILSEEGLAHRRGRGSLWRRDKTLATLAKAMAGLAPSEREHLDVRELDPGIAMNYMAVENGKIIIAAPYPATVHQSVPMLAVTVDTTSAFAVALRDDAEQLFECHGIKIDLSAHRPTRARVAPPERLGDEGGR